jgi:23S rRNA (uracil1939-C5)-methyltransferase
MLTAVREEILVVTALAAGGDGVARDGNGRVVFVPRTAPGDRVRVRVIEAKKAFARGEVVELVEAGAARVTPPCDAFARGCGGCAWLHVARAAQLAAKQELVAGALRKLVAPEVGTDDAGAARSSRLAGGLRVHAIGDPCAPLGWRRRARFHVAGGVVGLYAHGSHRVVPLAACPQLEPRLDAALAAAIAARPPDGELALLAGHAGDILVATRAAWPAGGELVDRTAPPFGGAAGRGQAPTGVRARIVGVNGHGAQTIEVEPGLSGGAWDFAQASAAGNAALVACAAAALGPGPGALLELHAGSGNLTRAFAAAGWTVTPSDVVRPAHAPGNFVAGAAADVVAAHAARVDAVALDPPRTGAADALAGIARLAPRTIVYVSCDPATLARDAAQLVAAGYAATDAWPLDLMPQTAHVEVVLRLVLRR